MKRNEIERNPIPICRAFVVLAMLPYSVLFWAVFSCLAIRWGFMSRTVCVVRGTIVGGNPLAVLLWWQPKMMRQILEKSLQ